MSILSMETFKQARMHLTVQKNSVILAYRHEIEEWWDHDNACINVAERLAIPERIVRNIVCSQGVF